MALWTVDIEKMLRGEYWTNRYIVLGNTLADAGVVALNILEIEQSVHCNVVLFTKMRVSDGLPNTDVYSIIQVNEFGAHIKGSAELPLFNVARVDFTTDGGGRPSRKYLRLPVCEDDQTDGAFTATFINFINTNYSVLLANLDEYVDVDGQTINDGSVMPFVGMRQLRRGSKRKALPVIP